MNNYFLVYFLNKKEAVFKKLAGFSKSGFMRLSLKDQIMFTKQLSVLLGAGIPLFSSLLMLKKQMKGRAIHTILDQVIGDIENGQSLSFSLRKFRNMFGDLALHIIEVGEASGSLAENLDYLNVSLKKKQILRRKLIGASVYPIFIIIATLVITAMLIVLVFPKIIPIFKSVHYALPWTTQALILISSVLKNHALLILFCMVIFIIIIWRLLKIPKIRFWYDSMLIHTPLINNIVIAYNANIMCKTLGLLTNSGITIVHAFEITSRTTINLVYKAELNIIAKKITKGEIASSHMVKNPKLFPAIMSGMVSVGESTGKLSETFSYLATVYEEEIDELTKNLSTAVEPLLLIFMGILVGFVAISIITPIYGITQHLTPR